MRGKANMCLRSSAKQRNIGSRNIGSRFYHARPPSWRLGGIETIVNFFLAGVKRSAARSTTSGGVEAATHAVALSLHRGPGPPPPPARSMEPVIVVFLTARPSEWKRKRNSSRRENRRDLASCPVHNNTQTYESTEGRRSTCPGLTSERRAGVDGLFARFSRGEHGD